MIVGMLSWGENLLWRKPQSCGGLCVVGSWVEVSVVGAVFGGRADHLEVGTWSTWLTVGFIGSGVAVSYPGWSGGKKSRMSGCVSVSWALSARPRWMSGSAWASHSSIFLVCIVSCVARGVWK